jgi:WASH complex subunit strumpellin
VYVPECTGWYQQSGTEVAGISLFSRINRGVGVFGMAGLDTVLAFRIVRDLQRATQQFQSTTAARGCSALQLLNEAKDALSPLHSVPVGAEKIYAHLERKLKDSLDASLQYVLRIGQAQLLRKSLRNELSFAAKLDSKLLYSTLEAFNDALLTDVAAHYKDDSKPYPSPTENPVLSEVGKYLEAAGMYDPLQKIYITSKPLEGFPVFLFSFLLRHLPSLAYDAHFGTLVRTKVKHKLDGAPLAAGLACILKQLHPSYTKQLLGLLGQYVRFSVHTATAGKRGAKATELPGHVQNVLTFLDLFCKFAQIERKVLEGYIPVYIFDCGVRGDAEK